MWVLFMSKDVTGGAKFQGREAARLGGMAGDRRRILESFNILEAEHTRAVVAKTRHLKRLDVYKAKFHRSLPEAENDRGHQRLPTSKDGTSGAKFLGREVGRGDTGEAEFQGREVPPRSKGNTGEAEFQGRGVLSRPHVRPSSSKIGLVCPGLAKLVFQEAQLATSLGHPLGRS